MSDRSKHGRGVWFMAGVLVGTATTFASVAQVQGAAAATESARADRVTKLVKQIKKERRAARVAKAKAFSRGYNRGRKSIVVRSDVRHMISVAAAHYGISASAAHSRARCESTYNPLARNGRFLGIYQLGDGRGDPWYASTGGKLESAGFTRTDALANILATMNHVQRYGWGQWECGGWSSK